MPNIGWAAAPYPWPPPVRPLPRSSTVRSFGKLEAQRSGDRIGFGEAQRELLADPVGLAALLADQFARRLIVAEIFLAQRLREHQAVTAEVGHRGEEAERLDAGDPALDQLADAVGEER